MADLGEIALEPREQRAFRAALQHFGDEGAAGPQNLAGEFGGEFDEPDDAELIRLLMAGRIGGHVGQDDIGRTAEPFAQ